MSLPCNIYTHIYWKLRYSNGYSHLNIVSNNCYKGMCLLSSSGSSTKSKSVNTYTFSADQSSPLMNLTTSTTLSITCRLFLISSWWQQVTKWGMLDCCDLPGILYNISNDEKSVHVLKYVYIHVANQSFPRWTWTSLRCCEIPSALNIFLVVWQLLSIWPIILLETLCDNSVVIFFNGECNSKTSSNVHLNMVS